MARFELNISDKFLDTLGRLADVDRVAPKMVEEALPTCKTCLVSSIEAKIDKTKNYSTGAMVASIEPSEVRQNNKGEWYGSARPTGKDKKGVRNAEKLAYFEYGTSKQPPRPVLDTAKNNARGPAKAKMAEVFEREMKL